MSDNYRILVTSPLMNEDALDVLSSLGGTVRELPLDQCDEAVDEAIIAFDPHAILSRSYKISARAIQGAPSLRVIAKHGSGVDNIDLDAARRCGVTVTNCAGVNAPAVAEHALALILAIAKQLLTHDSRMRHGRWSRLEPPGHLLQGRTLGLVGFGHIARRLALIARCMDMRVLAHGPRLRPSPDTAGVEVMNSLDDLLSQADVVSLHCPATAETRHLIGARELSLMGPEAWLINTARGSVVDEQALIAALSAGTIAAAGLDCFADEPIKADNPLLALDNVVLSPHRAGAAVESRTKVGLVAAQNIVAVLSGSPLGAGSIVVDARRAST